MPHKINIQETNRLIVQWSLDFGFKPEHESLYCVVGQDTPPRCINRYLQIAKPGTNAEGSVQ